MIQYIKIETGTLRTGQGFAADFNQDAPVGWICHRPHLKSDRFGLRDTSAVPFYFTSIIPVCIEGKSNLLKIFCYKNGDSSRADKPAVRKTTPLDLETYTVVLRRGCI